MVRQVRRLARTGTAPLVALARKQRVRGLLSSLVALPVLNALVLGGLYQTLGGEGFDLARFGAYWPYFIASTGFVAGAASWELELLSGLLRAYAGRPYAALWSRVAYVLLSSAPLLALFMGIRFFTSRETFPRDAVLMVVATFSLSVLGSGVALRLGFGHDKGINNLVQVAPWIFALGASPFFPQGVIGLALLFPANGSDLAVGLELARYAIYLVGGLLLAHAALGPRRSPVFTS